MNVERKEIVKQMTAIVLLLTWMIVGIPSLIWPLSMTIFEKAMISTVGAFGAFALYALWLLNRHFP